MESGGKPTGELFSDWRDGKTLVCMEGETVHVGKSIEIGETMAVGSIYGPLRPKKPAANPETVCSYKGRLLKNKCV